MIPALLRLPASTLADSADLDELAAVIDSLSATWLVVVGAQQSAGGEVLDEFAMATALVARRTSVRVGIATSVGAGRAHALIAREATTAQLLGACEVVLLDGDPHTCHDAAGVVDLLFQPGRHTMETPTGAIHGAVNDPGPSVVGGPPILWRNGNSLQRLVNGVDVAVGTVLDVPAVRALPDATADTLVVVTSPPTAPSALRSELAR